MDHIVIKVERVDDVDRGPIVSAPLPTVLTAYPPRPPKTAPGIKRLSAGCRIERGLIERDCGRPSMKDAVVLRVELPAVGSV